MVHIKVGAVRCAGIENVKHERKGWLWLCVADAAPAAAPNRSFSLVLGEASFVKDAPELVHLQGLGRSVCQ